MARFPTLGDPIYEIKIFFLPSIQSIQTSQAVNALPIASIYLIHTSKGQKQQDTELLNKSKENKNKGLYKEEKSSFLWSPALSFVTVLLCSSSCPGIHYVNHTDLELKRPSSNLPSARIKGISTTPSFWSPYKYSKYI